MNRGTQKRERPDASSSSDPKRHRVEELRPQVREHDSPSPPNSDYESLPSPFQLWPALGDKASTSFMHSQLGLEQYEQAVKLFHARLGLIVRGLSPDQLLAISMATLPDFAASADKSDKDRMFEIFEIAAAWMEDQIVRKMKQYATMWYQTPAGLKYAEDYQYAKRKKNATKFPFPEPPASAQAMLETPQQEGPPLPGLAFGKANVVDFWAAGLAAIKTEETPSGRLGWIADDEDDIWLTALERVALNLIRRYAVMAAGAPEKDVSRVAVKEAIRAFQSFSLAELTPQLRDVLVISPPPGGDLYKVDFSKVDPYLSHPPLPASDDESSRASTPEMTARQHRDFVSSATQGEPSFFQIAKEDKEKTLRDLAKASFDALRETEFPLREYRLDSLCAPSYTKDVAEQISLAYSRAPLKAKTELHVGQINMEIKRLRAVRSQYTAKISALESDLRTIRAREAKADDEDRIVQKLRAEMRALRADRDKRQAALDAREAAREKDSGDEDEETEDKETEDKPLAVTPAASTPARPAGPQGEYDDDETEEIERLMAASRG